jgi:hypothetical protein
MLLAVTAALPLVLGCHDDHDDDLFEHEWYVDALYGSDFSGDGTPAFPFRTITHALQHAESGDVIFVAPGTYSTSIGEVFPIIVRNGVTIEGEPGTKGMGSPATLVLGGGSSTISGGVLDGQTVNVAIVVSPNVVIRGLAITNTAGYGVIVNNTSSTIEFCTITQNAQDGLLLVNGASGTYNNNTLSANTGDGVRLRDHSVGSFVQNSIVNNVSDGVQADETSSPNLAGGNSLTGNGGVGLFNNTTGSTISAINNTWKPSVQGSTASGTYASALQAGPVAVVAGNNFAITNAAAAIQF